MENFIKEMNGLLGKPINEIKSQLSDPDKVKILGEMETNPRIVDKLVWGRVSFNHSDIEEIGNLCKKNGITDLEQFIMDTLVEYDLANEGVNSGELTPEEEAELDEVPEDQDVSEI